MVKHCGRLFTIIILGVLGTLILQGAVLASNEATTIDYTCFDEGQSVFYWFEDVFDKVEEKHNIKVNVTGIPTSEYQKTTMMRLATGEGPDLYPFYSEQLDTLIDEGYLAPLNPWLEGTDLEDRLAPVVKEVASKDGKIYAIARAIPPWMLHCNMKILNEVGIESPPANLAEFYYAAKKVKEETGKWGYVTFFDPGQARDAARVAMSWVIGFGGRFGQPGKVTINTPEVKEAMTWLKRFVEEDLMPTGLSHSESCRVFWEEEAAMHITGTWLVGFANEENPDLVPHIAVSKVPFPAHDSLTGGGWVGINANSDKKDAAWKVLKEMYSSEEQKKWIEISTRPGSTIDSPSEEWEKKIAPWWDEVNEVLENHVNHLGYAPPGFEEYTVEWQDTIGPYLIDIVLGRVSVDKGLEDAQNVVEKWAANKGLLE